MVPNSCQTAPGPGGVPVPHIQAPALSFSASVPESPPLSPPLHPSVPLSLPTPFLVTSPPSAPVSPALPFMLSRPCLPLCSSVSSCLLLSAPSHLSVFLPQPRSCFLGLSGRWRSQVGGGCRGEGSLSQGRDGPGFIMVCQVPWSSESPRKGAAEHLGMCLCSQGVTPLPAPPQAPCPDIGLQPLQFCRLPLLLDCRKTMPRPLAPLPTAPVITAHCSPPTHYTISRLRGRKAGTLTGLPGTPSRPRTPFAILETPHMKDKTVMERALD